MEDERTFHLGDILSVTTGYLVSPRHIEGVYDILNFLTGDSLFTHQLPRACEESTPWLERQHPDLSAGALRKDTDRLSATLETLKGREERAAAVDAWLVDMVVRFGETRTVRPIPREEHERRDPVEELEEKVGRDRVIPVRLRKPGTP